MRGAERWAEGCSWLGLPPIRGARGPAWVGRAAAGIKRRRAEGFSVRKIANRVGVASSTIHRWLRAAAAEEAGGRDCGSCGSAE